MLTRGKFKSLIMINWNGFFARQFDLDNLVTTLSGGNGAGKSTTMASFVTALIPDLSLLHFRNTTEAGSTSSSRDRGLYGKLQSGVCFAALECENSRGETAIFGVQLQQLTGRDKKVDLTLFSISGLHNYQYPAHEKAIDIFFRKEGSKAKILAVDELHKKFDKHETVTFKKYHRIADYHAAMFDHGFLPRRLSTAQDRSRYYRLIEASLYGGISSAITKSLREYLLTENTNVKEAFKNMENAIIENRTTLTKIDQTSQDRNFFRALVDATIDYVVSDYIYHLHNRQDIVNNALQNRQAASSLHTAKAQLNQSIANFAGQEQQLQSQANQLTDDFNKAWEYYNILLNASRLQGQYHDKLAQVSQYEEEEALLSEQVEELVIQQEELSSEQAALDDTIRGLNRKLADNQEALSEQSKRKLQYRNAVAQLEQLKLELVNALQSGNLPVNLLAVIFNQELVTANHDLATQAQELLQQLVTNKANANALSIDSNNSAADAMQPSDTKASNHQGVSFAQAQQLLANFTQAITQQNGDLTPLLTQQLAELPQEQSAQGDQEGQADNAASSQVSNSVDLRHNYQLLTSTSRATLQQQFTTPLTKADTAALELNLELVALLTSLIQEILTLGQQELHTLQRAKQAANQSQEDYQKTLATLRRLLNGANIQTAQAYNQAQVLLRGVMLKRNLAERLEQLVRDHANLSNKRDQMQADSLQINQLQQQLGVTFNSRQQLLEQLDLQMAQYSQAELQREEVRDALANLGNQHYQVTNQITLLRNQLQGYFQAQTELENLRGKVAQPLTTPEQLFSCLSHYLHLTNEQEITLKNLKSKRSELEERIYTVERQDLGGDLQLEQIAQDLGGRTLSSFYNDISYDDALYYSALFGPARDAIVVRSFDGIEEKLQALGDLPADLYLIEGDLAEFDESSFDANADEKAVLVRLSSQQLRYSTIQEITTFSPAARKKYLEQVKKEHEQLIVECYNLEDKYYKNKKLTEDLTNFSAKYSQIAFIANPEQELQQLQNQADQLNRQLTNLRNQAEQLAHQIGELHRSNNLLQKLTPLLSSDWEASANLEADYLRITNDMKQAQEAQRYLQQHERDLAWLEENIACLQYDPSQAQQAMAQLPALEQQDR